MRYFMNLTASSHPVPFDPALLTCMLPAIVAALTGAGYDCKTCRQQQCLLECLVHHPKQKVSVPLCIETNAPCAVKQNGRFGILAVILTTSADCNRSIDHPERHTFHHEFFLNQLSFHSPGFEFNREPAVKASCSSPA